MKRFRFSLNIGVANAGQDEVVEFDDEDFRTCENQEEFEARCESFYQDWASNYIDGCWELLDCVEGEKE